MSSSVRGAGGGSPSVAEKVKYDNTKSGIEATDVQTAIDIVSTEAKNAQNTAENAQKAADSKAPAYTYGTEDLIDGVSPLETGKLHFVY